MKEEHFDTDAAARSTLAAMREGAVRIERGLGLFVGPGGIQVLLLAPELERPFEEESKRDITLDYAWNIAVGNFDGKPYAIAVLDARWPDEGKGIKLLFDLLDNDSAFALLSIGAFGGSFSIVENATRAPGDGEESVLENLVGFQTDPDDPTFELAVGVSIRTLELGGAVEKIAELMLGKSMPSPENGFEPLAHFAGPMN